MSCASALHVPSAFCSNFKTHSESSHFSLPVPLLCWLEEHRLLPGLRPPLCPPHPHLWPGPSPTADRGTASAPNLAALRRFPTVKAKHLLKALHCRSVSLTRLPRPALRLAPAPFPPSPNPSSGAFVLPLAWDASPHSLLLASSTSRSLRIFSYWRRLPHRPPSFKKIDFPFGELSILPDLRFSLSACHRVAYGFILRCFTGVPWLFGFGSLCPSAPVEGQRLGSLVAVLQSTEVLTEIRRVHRRAHSHAESERHRLVQRDVETRDLEARGVRL